MEDSKEIFIPLSTRVELTAAELFSAYRYIPLETCSEALLPDQNHLKALYVRNGRIYVAANDLVYVFDQNGKHLFTLSHKGEGPDEYQQAYACIDKRTHQSKLIKTIRYDDYFRNEPRALFPLGDGWCGILLNAEEVVQKEAFAARFTGLNEESNPVLFIGKLK